MRVCVLMSGGRINHFICVRTTDVPGHPGTTGRDGIAARPEQIDGWNDPAVGERKMI